MRTTLKVVEIGISNNVSSSSKYHKDMRGTQESTSSECLERNSGTRRNWHAANLILYLSRSLGKNVYHGSKEEEHTAEQP